MKAKGPRASKGAHEDERAYRGKEPTKVNFKHSGGQNISLAPLANLSPALPLSK